MQQVMSSQIQSWTSPTCSSVLETGVLLSTSQKVLLIYVT